MNTHRFNEFVEMLETIRPHILATGQKFPVSAKNWTRWTAGKNTPAPNSVYTFAKGLWDILEHQNTTAEIKAKILEKMQKPVPGVKSWGTSHDFSTGIYEWANEDVRTNRNFPPQQTSSSKYLQLLPDLEDEIRHRYGLRDVVVVDASQLPRLSENHWRYSDDDLLHNHLGRWAGRVLSSLVRPGDIVGVGGGRGPNFTQHHLTGPAKNGVLKSLATQVVSLTGFIAARTWREIEEANPREFEQRQVDADGIAQHMHQKLGAKRRPRLLHCNIVGKHAPPKTADITIAVVGIGAFGGGHNFRRPNFEETDQPRKLVDLVNYLNDSVGKIEPKITAEDKYRYCIGDVCNSYFVLNDVKHFISAAEFNQLKNCVHTVNDAFLNTSLDALSQICKRGIVMAVAGGPHKCRAIMDVLKRRERGAPWITHLITDDQVARHILEIGSA